MPFRLLLIINYDLKPISHQVSLTLAMIGDEIWKSTGGGPTIAKLHAKREHLGIFLPIFEEDICDVLTATLQN